MKKIESICVYCGSSSGVDTSFEAAARQLGKSMAERGIRLVYGGGTHGLMGAVAGGVMEHGGKVTGIIPDFLMRHERSPDAMDQLDDFIVTQDMHTRKQLMFERADAFITLPGGIGTLEEVVEMITWGQLDRHNKPIAFANLNGFWNPFITLIDHMADGGFLHSQNKIKPLFIDDIDAVVPAIIDEAASRKAVAV
jgi:hypothetical protein